jgi:SAM-dependent methyltransferase
MALEKLRDPFETEMADYGLYPAMDNVAYADYYSAIAIKWRKGDLPKTSEAEIGTIIGELTETLWDAELAKSWVNAIRPQLSNPALAKFMRDHGCRSRYFVPWLINVPKAFTLEAAFGFGLDSGGGCCQIAKDDPFFQWVVRDPMFVYLRERALNTGERLRNKQKAVFLGAGYLPDLRRSGLKWEEMPEVILACDHDPSILQEPIAADLKDKLQYVCYDIKDFLMSCPTGNDVVVMNGVMSYRIDWLPFMVNEALRLLKPGGQFIFDLQLKHWSLVRNGLVFNWVTNPPMTLMENEAAAKYAVERVCQGLPVRLDCRTDSRNEIPTGVMCYITKEN